MQAPKKRTSHSKRNMRRAHDALTPVQSGTCKNCNEPVLTHRVCKACGHYRGKLILKSVAAAAQA